MSKSSVLAWILAYVGKNKLIAALKVKSQKMMVVKTTQIESFEFGHNGQETASESRRLDCIYDDEPLGFEKDPLTSTKRMQAQDPLKEIDPGDSVAPQKIAKRIVRSKIQQSCH